MTLITKNIRLDRLGIRRIKDFETLRKWLEDFVISLIKAQRQGRESAESGGAGTPNWNIREATDADVIAGDAHTKGNLIIEHKITGTKREFES